MERIFTLILLLLSCTKFLGQAPEKISYQAIIRNADQSLVSASKVNLKMVLRQKSVTGAVIYEETHSTSTNDNGLVSLEIGKGTESTGDFSQIPWAEGPFFLEIQVDVNGGTNYDQALLARMNQTQHHRGPDETGLHAEPGVGLAHKRLSV